MGLLREPFKTLIRIALSLPLTNWKNEMNAMEISKVFPPRCASHAALSALLIAASAMYTSGAVMAAVVCNSGTVPIPVPQTTAGVYVNLVTGLSGPAPAAAPGWDINPFGTTQLSFFKNAEAGMGYVGTGANINVLAAGTPIDATSVLATTGASPGFRAGVVNGYLGVVFRDQAALLRYGWVSLTTTTPTGFPATITGYCYQDDGTGITAGTTPVSLQNFSVD